MANKSININHSDAAILSNDGTYVKLGANSAVKVGNGSSISNGDINNFQSNILEPYEGAIRINKTSNKLEYCNGTTWVEFISSLDGGEDSMVYSFII